MRDNLEEQRDFTEEEFEFFDDVRSAVNAIRDHVKTSMLGSTEKSQVIVEFRLAIFWLEQAILKMGIKK